MSMRQTVLGALILMLAVLIAGCATTAERGSATETVVILKTGQGDIALRFFPDVAPEHVKNFIAHSESGYYADTCFHRVIPGFVIQGGDPNTKDDDPDNDGMGGYSYKGEGTTLPAEFNERLHVRGTLSMARAQDVNSAGSQFFICHADAPFLDNKYTVFGETIDGIRVVDKIVNVERDKRDRPLVNQVIEGVVVDQWPVEKIESMKAKMWAAEGVVTDDVMKQDEESSGPGILFWHPDPF